MQQNWRFCFGLVGLEGFYGWDTLKHVDSIALDKMEDSLKDFRKLNNEMYPVDIREDWNFSAIRSLSLFQNAQ